MKARKLLWEISVATTPEAEDAVTEMLGSLLQLPVSAYLNVETGKSAISAFSDKPFPPAIRKSISARLNRIKNCGLKIGSGRISIGKIRREDWAESWKRHFKPVEIGGALLIKPSWSKKRPRKNQAVVVLDPGLSFGTGQHPTTAFCLRAIVAATPRRHFCGAGAAATKSFLDLGTGSGILAMAAAKLGFAPVDAVDCDADAIRIARGNARKNGVAGKIRFRRGDVAKLPLRPARQYDLVCANLISNLLIAERRRISAQLNRRGTLVLAGISKSEFAAVEKKFAELGLKLVSAKTEKEWRSGAFRFA